MRLRVRTRYLIAYVVTVDVIGLLVLAPLERWALSLTAQPDMQPSTLLTALAANLALLLLICSGLAAGSAVTWRVGGSVLGALHGAVRAVPAAERLAVRPGGRARAHRLYESGRPGPRRIR